MAEPGHAPTNGRGNRLYNLGRGKCPECESRPDLQPGGDSCLVCPKCDSAFRVGGGF